MEERGDDKLSSSLPETLHAHIIRPDNSDGRSDEASSSAQDRRPTQRQPPRPTSQFTSSLTPATFPINLGTRGTSSHAGLASPDVEDGGKSTQRVPRTSARRGGSAPARSAHPPRAILIPYDHRISGNGEPPFYHHHPSYSYTYPPPAPSHFYVSSPNTFQWPENGAGPSSSSHRARRPSGSSHSPGGYREGDDDDDDSEATHEVTLLQSRSGPESLPPFFARDVTRSRENSPRLYSALHSYNDSRYPQPPPQLPEPDSIPHHSLPSHRWDQRSHSWFSSSRHVPGIFLDDRPAQGASSYSLPPVSALLTSLRREYYNRVPQLPPLALPDRTPEIPPREVSAEEKESSSEKPTDSRNTSGRGKRKRSNAKEVPNERKKVARKIYVACHFCRGRKLRCDGTKPSCANCSTRTLECTYQEHPRRRGPGKAPKGSRTKKSEVKGRKGRKTSKAATSDADRESGYERPPSAGPDRHVFEPPMMLPGHGRPHLSELEAVYAPLPYSDRSIAPNTHHEGPEMIPRYQFSGNVIEHRGEVQPPHWGQDGDEEDGGSLDSRYALPPGFQKGDTDEEPTN